MNLFFTSDTHFGHSNIIRYCHRPFASAEEMDEVLVERWNGVVRPQDHVYHLGDVAMRRQHLPILKRLHGHLRLVRGNHDVFKTKEYLQYFDEIYGMRVFDNLLFTHVPVHPISLKRFRANVHGHTHEVILGEPYLNISVEQTNYTPVSFEDLKKALDASFYRV